MLEPTPECLCDLFNFTFNQKSSLLDPESDYLPSWCKPTTTQSQYLFFKKFGGTNGLLEKLRSNFKKKDAPNGIADNQDNIKYR